MDAIAMWIGYLVMGISSGIFVLGGGMIVADVFGRRLWQRLKALHGLENLRTYAEEMQDRNDALSRTGDPVIPQPKPWRHR